MFKLRELHCVIYSYLCFIWLLLTPMIPCYILLLLILRNPYGLMVTATMRCTNCRYKSNNHSSFNSVWVSTTL